MIKRLILLILCMFVGLLPWTAMPALADGHEVAGTNAITDALNMGYRNLELTNSVTTDTVRIQSGWDVTINLNSHDISIINPDTAASAIFIVENGGKLTIKDKENGIGRIIYGAARKQCVSVEHGGEFIYFREQ